MMRWLIPTLWCALIVAAAGWSSSVAAQRLEHGEFVSTLTVPGATTCVILPEAISRDEDCEGVERDRVRNQLGLRQPPIGEFLAVAWLRLSELEYPFEFATVTVIWWPDPAAAASSHQDLLRALRHYDEHGEFLNLSENGTVEDDA